MRPKLTHAILLVWMVSGAFALPVVDPIPQQSAAAPTIELKPIPEGKAMVYMFNGSGRTLFGISATFKIDRRDVVKLTREPYSEIAVDPGSHKFEANGEKLKLDVELRKYYFVMYAFHPGKSWAAPFAGKPYFFGEVTQDRACELMATYKHAEISVEP